MSFTTIGDLSQSFQLRRDNARLKGDLQRLTAELSSGRTTDIRAATRGDLRPLASLERSVSLLASFRTSNAEAALFTEVAQSALAGIESGAGTQSAAALLARTSAVPAQIDAVGREGTQQFEAAVSRLNVQAAGRTVFAGLATDGPALLPASDILDALQTATAGATTAADVTATLDAWFAPGGAFDTAAYAGSADPLRPFRVSQANPSTCPSPLSHRKSATRSRASPSPPSSIAVSSQATCRNAPPSPVLRARRSSRPATAS